VDRLTGGPERYTLAVDVSEVPPSELDDERDREELRNRYYGLLEELRVLLPGVQLLQAGIMASRIGLVALVISLLASITVVCAFVFDDTTAYVVIGALVVIAGFLWGGLPLVSVRAGQRRRT
jgi:hypothetical protein